MQNVGEILQELNEEKGISSSLEFRGRPDCWESHRLMALGSPRNYVLADRSLAIALHGVVENRQ